jgi:hypothetical protein
MPPGLKAWLLSTGREAVSLAQAPRLPGGLYAAGPLAPNRAGHQADSNT